MYYKSQALGRVFYPFLFCLTLISCKKDWLEAKPELALVVPHTLKDYQALLDNTSGGNGAFNINQSVLGEISAGDFYITDDTWDMIPLLSRNSYIWASDIYGGEISNGDWALPYNCIFNANVILEGVNKISPTNNAEQQQWYQIKGSALFYRAYWLFQVANLYAKVYDKNTASSDLGIPLRLESDINKPSKRASVEETYNQILNDLKSAADILPIEKPGLPDDKLYRLRPTKAAANAMLARVYLSMSEYENALNYSNKLLTVYNELMDYNEEANNSGFFKFQMFNKEVILHVTGANELIVGTVRANMDSNLVKLYDINDRRKDLFVYTAAPWFLGNYTAGQTLFTGLATDEILLIQAECLARLKRKDEAMGVLNTLMRKRWNNSVVYVDMTATDDDDALNKVLVERRKELCYRCLRWADVRRLNKEPSHAITLNRTIKGGSYTLEPNSPKYVLPIPQDVIQLSGIEQNQR